jgi:hypothetical protein
MRDFGSISQRLHLPLGDPGVFRRADVVRVLLFLAAVVALSVGVHFGVITREDGPYWLLTIAGLLHFHRAAQPRQVQRETERSLPGVPMLTPVQWKALRASQVYLEGLLEQLMRNTGNGHFIQRDKPWWREGGE